MDPPSPVVVALPSSVALCGSVKVCGGCSEDVEVCGGRSVEEFKAGLYVHPSQSSLVTGISKSGMQSTASVN